METTISINLNDVFYNVKNNSYVTGASRRDGNNFELVANMQASNDTEHKEKILRAIQSAQTDLIVKLAEYYPLWQSSATASKGDLSEGLLDTSPKNNVSTVLLQFFRLPSNYNSYMDASIAQSVHQFLYNQAMVDWFLATDKADVKEYADAANENIQKIRKAINKRVKPNRTQA